MTVIERFNKVDQNKIRKLILNIQNVEFHLGFKEDEQPDLIDTEKYYSTGAFWTAKINGEIVGTIGLQNLGNQNAVLKKMFVKKELRGKPHNIGQSLFNTLINYAKEITIKTIWLDTPSAATASHKFYERNGFRETDKLNLPKNYVFPDRDSKIYKLILENEH